MTLRYCPEHPAQAEPCRECPAAEDELGADPWAEVFPPHLCRTVVVVGGVTYVDGVPVKDGAR